MGQSANLKYHELWASPVSVDGTFVKSTTWDSQDNYGLSLTV